MVCKNDFNILRTRLQIVVKSDLLVTDLLCGEAIKIPEKSVDLSHTPLSFRTSLGESDILVQKIIIQSFTHPHVTPKLFPVDHKSRSFNDYPTG